MCILYIYIYIYYGGSTAARAIPVMRVDKGRAIQFLWIIKGVYRSYRAERDRIGPHPYGNYDIIYIT